MAEDKVRFIKITKERYETKKAEGTLDSNAFYKIKNMNGNYEFYLGDTKLSNDAKYDKENEMLTIE